MNFSDRQINSIMRGHFNNLRLRWTPKSLIVEMSAHYAIYLLVGKVYFCRHFDLPSLKIPKSRKTRKMKNRVSGQLASKSVAFADFSGSRTRSRNDPTSEHENSDNIPEIFNTCQIFQIECLTPLIVFTTPTR